MPQLRNSNNLAAAIGSISTGGGASPEPKDVNFYDYDGVLLYSYYSSEAAELSDLPALPAHTGLTADSWTHTLTQVMAAAQSGRNIDIGALYTVSDNSSRFYITIPHSGNLTVPLKFTGNVTIDWGDGTVEQVFGSTTHTYTPSSYPADYIIKVTGTVSAWGDGNNSIFSGSDSCRHMLKEARIHAGRLDSYAFSGCKFLETIVLSPNVNVSNAYLFLNCSSLKAFIFNSFPGYNGEFSGCYSLGKAVISDTPNTLNNDVFRDCGFSSYIIPETVTTIKNNAVANCRKLRSIVIPPSVTTIGTQAFEGCGFLTTFDLTAYDDPAAIPALSNSNAFSSTSPMMVMLVKNQAMLSAFTAATNWSTWANRFRIKGD